MNHEVRAAASKPKKGHGGKKGPVRRMVLERASNGVVSTTEHEPAEGSDMSPWHSSMEEKVVHPSASHLKKHVAAKMFPDTNDEEAAEDEKS